jgi:hypothetical protein
MKIASSAAVARLAILAIVVGVNYGVLERARHLSLQPSHQVLLLGGAPMVQLLALAYVVGRRAPRSRPFVRGFLVAGVAAMLAFVVVASLMSETLIVPIIRGALAPLVARLPANAPLGHAKILALNAVGVLLLLLPQLIVALLGGFWTYLLGETDERPNIPDRRPRSASPKP